MSPIWRTSTGDSPSIGGASKQKKLRGANGTQVTSKTVANGWVGQYKYRI